MLQQQFFIQNSDKYKIYDDDVFIESTTDCLDQLEEEVPEIVRLSRAGSLPAVQALLADCPPDKRSNVLNSGAVWTDGDEVRLTGDTALSAAAKEGHLDVVVALLVEGADTTIESSTLQGHRETVTRGVESKIKSLETVLRNILNGKHFIYDRDAWTEPEDVIHGSLAKLNKLKKCLKLIKVVEKYLKKTKARKAKMLENIQAKISCFLERQAEGQGQGDGRQHQEGGKFNKLVKSYQKLLLDKRMDIIRHTLGQKKRNFAPY